MPGSTAKDFDDWIAKALMPEMVRAIIGHDEPAPPMPASAVASDAVDRMADAIVALINSKPRSPTKEEIAAVLAADMAKRDLLLMTHEKVLRDNPVGDNNAPRREPMLVQWPTAEFPPVAPPGYVDQDGNVIALKPFMQYEGPPMRYYEHGEGDQIARYQYQSFAWQTDEPSRFVACLDELSKALLRRGVHTIIWRTRPEMMPTHIGGRRFQFFCRFHTIPYMCLASLPGAWAEGDLIPEA